MLRLREIDKSFAAIAAVRGASLEIAAGEIVAVVGENGAGKTTLMRIAAGELPADRGTIERSGLVALVHQHFMLVDSFTIAENLALGTSGPRFFTPKGLDRKAEATIAGSGIALTGVSRRVATLSVGEKSKLALIKAIARKPDVLILDEPTSVLTPSESDELFAVLRRLAAQGTSIVFISHKISEVLRVAQRIIVMRSGAVVGEYTAKATTASEIAQAMVNLPPETARPFPSAHGGSAGPRKTVLKHGDLVVHEGEILAIAGVAGNGQSELASVLRDLHPEAGHIPEDRTRDGIIASMSIAENLALRAAEWSPRTARRNASDAIARYGIRAGGPGQRAGDLSGGNQQKLLLARELDRRVSLIVAAEPTRGLDIEAAAFVHQHLRDAAAGGAAIVLITSDLDEAFALAETVQVINRGRLSERMAAGEATDRVASLMGGIT